MNRCFILLLLLVASASASGRLLLTWSYTAPPPRVIFFRVYQQDVVVRPGGAVTTDWLTNGWRSIGATWKTNFTLVQTNDASVLHAFTVTAVDANTGAESDMATK